MIYHLTKHRYNTHYEKKSYIIFMHAEHIP